MGMARMTWGRRGRPHPLTHPLTHPSIQPPMIPPMARGVSANHKSSNRIELSWLSQDLFNFLWFDMAPPINPPNHPPTHQTIHPPIGGGVSPDFKSSNRIKISQFVQVLLNFYWFGWSPRVGVGVGGGLNGGLGMMWQWQGWCGDDRDDMGMTGMTWGRWGRHHYHDKHVGGHLQFLHVCVRVCMHACMCMHVHVCAHVWGHPPIPPDPPPPTCPLPRAAGSPKHQNSISPKRIKIIQFCLKILYLRTFLNSYRL